MVFASNKKEKYNEIIRSVLQNSKNYEKSEIVAAQYHNPGKFVT